MENQELKAIKSKVAKGRSQKFYREDKGLLGGKWPKKPIKMASSDGKKHYGN